MKTDFPNKGRVLLRCVIWTRDKQDRLEKFHRQIVKGGLSGSNLGALAMRAWCRYYSDTTGLG